MRRGSVAIRTRTVSLLGLRDRASRPRRIRRPISASWATWPRRPRQLGVGVPASCLRRSCRPAEHPVAMSSSRPRSTPVEMYEGLCQHCSWPLRVTISVVTEGPNAGKRVCHVAGAHRPRSRSRSRPRNPSPRLDLNVEVEAPESVALSPTEVEHESTPPAGGDATPVGGLPPAGHDDPGPPSGGDAPVTALEDMPLHELAKHW